MVAYNLGFEAAQGEYILVMDDDGLPARDDWIEQVVARFEANPRLGSDIMHHPHARHRQDRPRQPAVRPRRQLRGGYPGVAFNGTGAGLRTEALRGAGYYPWHFSGRTWNCTSAPGCSAKVGMSFISRNWKSGTVAHQAPGTPLHVFRVAQLLWYIWELYPWPQVLGETFHELG